MAYITISNTKKLVKKLDEINLNSISEDVYSKPIFFLNKRETANLKGIREFFKNPETFFAEYYKPIEIKDSYRYVYPESQPSYHKDASCIKLHSGFMNYEVPSEIFEKGVSEVEKFRIWFKKNKAETLLPKEYVLALTRDFAYIKPINPRSIDLTNSGVKEIENYSVEDLKQRIESKLTEAENYFHSSPSVRDILYRYQKMTFLGYVRGPIKNNNSGMKDEDLKSFLKAYEEGFKTPVKNDLIEYYRMLFNPDLQFKNSILEQIGFKACKNCIVEYATLDNFAP